MNSNFEIILDSTHEIENNLNNVDKAYFLIKEKIQQCKYLPGQFLSEKEIVDELGLSRTPVREALGRLEGEKKIKKIVNKGIMIEEISLLKLKKIYEIRLVLESYAIKEALKYIKEDDIEFLKDLYNEMELETYLESIQGVFKRGANIHTYISKMSNNEILYSMIKNLREECYRGNVYYMLRSLDVLSKEERALKCQNILEGHKVLIEALIEKNEKKALAALEKDLVIFTEVLK